MIRNKKIKKKLVRINRQIGLKTKLFICSELAIFVYPGHKNDTK